MQRLTSKVALVTGGAEGLGKAIAQRLTKEGARVAITDVQTTLGRATAAELGCDFLTHDVTDEAQWESVVRSIQDRHGALHILVNNAGILGASDRVSPEDTALADWRRIFAVNVEGVFLGCRAAIPAIHASGGGSIVNMSSVAGLLATPYAAAYGASKAAVRQLTKSVAQHCLERGMKIRCNSVHPGVVRTPLWERYVEKKATTRGVPFETAVKDAAAAVPMGELVTPEDIAAAVLFLVSNESQYVTGAKLIVDGGIVHCDTYSQRMLQRRSAERQ